MPAFGLIDQDNEFTSEFGISGPHRLSIHASSDWQGTITIQRRGFDEGSEWSDVETHASSVEEEGFFRGGPGIFRAGCKAGDHVSGSAAVSLG